MRAIIPLLLTILVLSGAASAGSPTASSVTVYHGDPARLGNFPAPGLTPSAAHTLRPDTGFDARIDGKVYAQPLFWWPAGAARGEIIVATETDNVYALDPATGHAFWTTSLGQPAPRATLECGDIDPLGVTGTPVIDRATGALYLDAMVMRNGAPHHLVFGLSLASGKVLPGWPVDVGTALGREGIRFDPRIQNQRAALALLDGRIYVAFGGHSGDCGAYHGIVAAFATDTPRLAAIWRTRGVKGGIWAPNGVGVADGHVYFATGNTETGADWADGEGVFRLGPDLARTADPRDFFAPRDWKALDDADLDMSGTGPLPIDFPGARRLLALGKNGVAYLLDRDDLGGFGGEIAHVQVAHSPIIGGPAVFPHGDRRIVVFRAHGSICPDGRFAGGIAAISVGPHGIVPLWCAPFSGRGSPVVTTTNGTSDPIVWIAGDDADEKLHGYDGLTGKQLYESARLEQKLAPFQTLLVANRRIYVAVHGRVAAFTWADEGFVPQPVAHPAPNGVTKTVEAPIAAG